MKNKILKSLLAVVMLLPCMMLFTACGKLKSLAGDTFVFSKVEVTGTVNQQEVEDDYKLLSYEFTETTMIYKDGSEEENSCEYKFEDGKLFIKAEGDEFSNEPFAVASGKFLVVTEEREGGTVKIYFKIK